jgi:hypothetical protein
MSDLENNLLEHFGEDDDIQFNQNTVPFDFDGKRLLWLTYLDKDIREIWIYNFENRKKEKVETFGGNDGMISHAKFLKEPEGGGDFLFYVKNCQYVMQRNLKTNETTLIGRASDAIIAFNV